MLHGEVSLTVVSAWESFLFHKKITHVNFSFAGNVLWLFCIMAGFSRNQELPGLEGSMV